MPSPAAGKNQDTPRTPTKLGRKPQSQRTPKLGEQAKDQQQQQQQKPEAPEMQKPETDTPDLPPRPSVEGESGEDVKGKAEDTAKKAKDAPQQASETASETGDEATGKVSEATGELKEQEPKPLSSGEEDNDTDQPPKKEAEDDDDDDTATEKAGDLGEEAEDTAESAQPTPVESEEPAQAAQTAGRRGKKSGGNVLNGAKNLAGRASSLAGQGGQGPRKAAQGAEDTAEGAAEGAQDTAEGAKDIAQDTTEGAQDTAEGAKDTAQDTTEGAQDTAEGAKDTAEGATGAVDEAKDTAEGAADQAKGAAEDTTGQELPDTPDLSILKGLEVQEDGSILDNEGNQIGRLVEGDAEDLQGYSIGEDGEILDDDGDLVGRCEVLPEKVDAMKKQAEDKAKQGEPKLPGLDILNGLTVNQAGEIFNEDGDVVGRVTDGDVSELKGRSVNEKGEILDDDGNVIGHAEIHPDAADLIDQDEDETPDGAAEAAEGAPTDATGEAVEGAKSQTEGAKSRAEDEIPDLPGVSALEGREINSEGEIVDDEGNVLGQVADGVDVSKVKGLTVNEAGEVVDEDGNVLGKVELAEGAAEKLQEELGPMSLDLRILEGLKVNKKGKVLNEEGEEIGQLTEGELKYAAGKTINDKGEVVDKDGKVVGKVEVVPGEAANEAMNELRERLGEVEEDTGPKQIIPNLDIMDGLKVNKKGQVLNEDGDPIGELMQGELSDCAGKKINDQGEVLDKDGNIIGRVRALPQEMTPSEAEEAIEGGAEEYKDEAEDAQEAAEDAQEGAETAQENAEQAAEDAEQAGPELPPLSTLDGLTVNKAGKLVNDDGVIVGELTEGDAKKLSKMGVTADDQGQFWDNKGNVIGRAQTVPIDDGNEEGAFAGLEGLIVVKDGYVEDENGNKVGIITEGDAKKLVGRAVDEDGDIIDKKGSVVGHAERWEEEEPEPEPEEEPLDLSMLAGKTLNKQGNVIGDEGVPVARLVEGNAKELVGKRLDDQGQIWNDQGKVIGRVELIPENERESKPEGPFAGLQGLRVVADGKIADEDENIVGEITEGNPKRLIGLAVDEDGDIIDRYGNVKGHAEPLEEEPEEEIDLSILDGKLLNKQGYVVNEEGIPFGRLVEGNVKELAGRRCDEEGLIHNDTGKIVGRCELIPASERESKPEGPFAGLEGLRVIADGKVADEDGNVVGEITEGDPRKLIGNHVDEDGDIIDKHGNVKGHAEPLPEEEAEAPPDLSILDGKMLNKQGFVVNEDGIPLGKLVEGNVKELAGRRCDEEGQIHGDTGKVVGRCELIPENERVAKPEGPFAGLEGLKVVHGGKVEDIDGNVVGEITEGDPKKLLGNSVDEDGDIIDKYGNVKGHAEPWEEEEQTPEDLSALAGCTVNKAGNVVDSAGAVIGRIAEGDPKTMVGKKVDGQGQIWDNAGNVVGRAELAKGADTTPEGPFAGFDSITVVKDGLVVTPDGSIVGRVIEGDVKKLVGHHVDEEGDISDKHGNTIGKAERWEPEEKERRINPMSGRRVNKEGEVRDENGDIMGRLTAGDLGHCAGLEVDDNGYVIDNDGNKVGEVTLLANIVEEEEEEEGLTEEELEELRKKKEDAELADKMANICQQTLERVQPVCKQITEYIEKADRTPREELDEEELVNNVKPLIEEGGRILQECNGSLRGLDPDGRIAAQAKGRANTREATPEEYRLADCLKELTTTVVTTIDNAKKKIADMPHAKKKLNPLWALLTEPLFQIIAAVGLLLSGVLGLVGRLLNGLGLGGLVNGLLGGLGIHKLLSGLGLGSISEALGGKKEKKKSGGGGAAGLPLVGGMFGGK
ncbi:uncharacterized protein K452DRAFT_219148 [Aplosporella prunicola CBS 121167]|uniref:DUF6987 domain-containing protein n=1 Tax=Aplosporella prunicola CBS 121167 TaxID=1176127 RepID=A0A6A6BRV2_9PEZI|nr:uncharacterized protein K452DRAFT_219148 [Aplosporella prunicola CBS 121167]KAF2146816.1 hypothetical protein K452DRAFT_219148 [Aplosporella prunicola CBS 121167]